MVFYLLLTAYVVREEVMFSLCPPFRGGTYLLDGGGVPTLRSGWWGGTYLPRSGGVPTLRSGWGGGLPTFPGLGEGGSTRVGTPPSG